MKKFEDVLRSIRVAKGLGGGDGDTKPLLDALEEHCCARRQQNRIFVIAITTLIVIVIAALTYDFIAQEGKLLPLTGAAGLGISTLTPLLIASISDLSKTELLLRIARASDAPSIRGMIDRALAK